MCQSPKDNNNYRLDEFLRDNLDLNPEMKKKSEHSSTKNSSGKQPQNFIQKWNKGDIIFKGKFSSGITPKLDRPVVKALKVKSNKKQKLFEEDSMEDIETDHVVMPTRNNPFLTITPQMNRKIRKCSFDDNNNNNMELDFSSPTRAKKISETPAP